MKREVLHVSRTRPTLAALLFVGIVTAVVGACAWFQRAGAIAEDVVVDCAGPLIESEVADIIDAAKDIITKGETDWPRQLDNLVSNSVWAGYCAVQVVLNDLTPPVVSTAPMATGPAPAAVARAQAYLAAHHAQVQHAGTAEHYRAIRARQHAEILPPSYVGPMAEKVEAFSVDPIPLEDAARRARITDASALCSPTDIGGCAVYDAFGRWASVAIPLVAPTGAP